MHRFIRPFSSPIARTAISLLLVATSAGAQRATKEATILEVTPYGGYMVFGNYLNGPLGTSLTNAPGPIYGAQLGLALAPNISLFGNLGRASGDLRVGLPILGGVSVGSSSMLIYDGGLQLDLPLARTASIAFVPFLQAGVGGIRYDVDASVLHSTATNAVGSVGVGGDVAVGRGVALRLMVKDYIGKFDFKEATSFNLSSATAHNWAFSAGLRFDL